MAARSPTPLADEVAGAGAVVSTIPADAAAAHPRCRDARRCCSTRSTIRGRRRWPPRSTAAGGTVIDGLQMLLHQAFAQVEQFTGRPAPKEAMRAAVQRR